MFDQVLNKPLYVSEKYENQTRLVAYKILNSSMCCRVPNNWRGGNERVWNFFPYIINRGVLNNRGGWKNLKNENI